MTPTRVVKKKKRQSFDAQVQAQLEIFQQQSEARYRIAMDAFKAQDEQTQEVIGRIRDRIVAYSTGIVKIAPQGYSGLSETVQVDFKYVDFNALYMACGIMSDLAMVGVRVASYEFPPGICSECGSLLRPKRRKSNA